MRSNDGGKFNCFHDSTFRIARVRHVTIPWWTIANGHHDVLYSSTRFNGRSGSLELLKTRCNYYSSCFADFVDCVSFDAQGILEKRDSAVARLSRVERPPTDSILESRVRATCIFDDRADGFLANITTEPEH